MMRFITLSIESDGPSSLPNRDIAKTEDMVINIDHILYAWKTPEGDTLVHLTDGTILCVEEEPDIIALMITQELHDWHRKKR